MDEPRMIDCPTCEEEGYTGHPHCPACRGAGKVPDNRCADCGVDSDLLLEQLAKYRGMEVELAALKNDLEALVCAWAPVLSRRGDETVDMLMMVGCYDTLNRILGGK